MLLNTTNGTFIITTNNGDGFYSAQSNKFDKTLIGATKFENAHEAYKWLQTVEYKGDFNILQIVI